MTLGKRVFFLPSVFHFLMSICSLTCGNNTSLVNYLVAGGANASCSAEVTDRSRSSNPNGPGIRLQFKQPVTKNLHHDNPLEKSVSIFLFTM